MLWLRNVTAVDARVLDEYAVRIGAKLDALTRRHKVRLAGVLFVDGEVRTDDDAGAVTDVRARHDGIERAAYVHRRLGPGRFNQNVWAAAKESTAHAAQHLVSSKRSEILIQPRDPARLR